MKYELVNEQGRSMRSIYPSLASAEQACATLKKFSHEVWKPVALDDTETDPDAIAHLILGGCEDTFPKNET